MYYAIMDLTEIESMCCKQPRQNQKCVKYRFSVIITNEDFKILENFNAISCEKELHKTFSTFIKTANKYMNSLHGIFFGQKIKKLLKTHLNMNELSPKEKAFIFDSVNLRSSFSKMLGINDLSFKTFFKMHGIRVDQNGKDSYSNVLSIRTVLCSYTNIDSIMKKMIKDEKNYQIDKVKRNTQQRRAR